MSKAITEKQLGGLRAGSVNFTLSLRRARKNFSTYPPFKLRTFLYSTPLMKDIRSKRYP